MTLKKTILTSLLLLCLTGFGGTLVVFSGMYLYLNPQLPSIAKLQELQLQVPLRVYSSDGKLVGEFGEKRRTPAQFEEIPKVYINAILAAEDAEFFSHSGVSIKGLTRAFTELVLTGEKGSGGSTITMQVARNYYLTLKRQYTRKFKEILLALKIERELNKQQILELYVNKIFLGNRAYGIKAASQVYYGKPLSELSLAQTAMIAGLPKGPSIMNPLINPVRAIERRNWILERMLELGTINQQEYQEATAEPVTAAYHQSIPEINAPYIAEMARAEAIERLGNAAYNDGYVVYTTIDSKLQASANSAVVKGVMEYDQRHGYRGPEQELPALAPPLEEGFPLDYSPWRDALSEIPAYANLRPAAVTKVEEQAIEVLLSTGETMSIKWEQGLKNLRPYISENARGPAIKSAEEAFKPGDVVRINTTAEGEHRLQQLPNIQAALVSVNPHNGAVLSLVGGFDFGLSNFNRVVQAERQAGSNLKPFVYTAALENGMTPATVINDAPIVFDDSQLEDTWRPENAGGKFYGPTRLRTALYRSRNLVSIRVLRETGIGNTLNTLERFGFDKKKLPRDLSLSLGSAGITPMQMAAAYAVFANSGYRIEPYVVTRILDSEGRVVHENFPKTVCSNCDETQSSDDIEEFLPELEELANLRPENSNGELKNEDFPSYTRDELPDETDELNDSDYDENAFEFPLAIKTLLNAAEAKDFPRAEQTIDDQTIFLVDSMLRDVIKRGTGVKAKSLGRGDIAGKTGTTNGPKDAWFSGYSRNVVTTTWVGFDKFKSLGNREYGGTAALPIWINYMKDALNRAGESYLPQPPGIVTVKINPETGYRARPNDPDAIFEYFPSNKVPPLNENVVTPYDGASPEQRLTEELF